MIGQLLGHCRILAKIGEGGMGVVYRAYDEVLHRDVAVKVRDRIVTEQGDVREHINIFIAQGNIRYTGGLASPVTAESEISIVPAVSGG